MGVHARNPEESFSIIHSGGRLFGKISYIAIVEVIWRAMAVYIFDA